MKSLKLTKAEKKEMYDSPVAASKTEDYGGPEYPYGTRLDFDGKLVDKLDIGDLNVDDKVMVRAVGRVVSKSVNDSDRQDGPRKRIEIQMTAIEIGEDLDVKTRERKEMWDEMED
jgi:hypothetical protein